KADFSGCKAVLTQLEIPVAAAEAAMARGREIGAATILNPAPVRPLPAQVLKLVDVLTPNETEAKVLAAERPDCSLRPEEVARRLIELGVKTVIMTLGEQGALMVTSSSVVHVPAIRVKAVDTTGAGDAFNAGLAVSLASGASLEEAVRFAVVTGGLAVTKEGGISSLPRRVEGGRSLGGWSRSRSLSSITELKLYATKNQQAFPERPLHVYFCGTAKIAILKCLKSALYCLQRGGRYESDWRYAGDRVGDRLAAQHAGELGSGGADENCRARKSMEPGVQNGRHAIARFNPRRPRGIDQRRRQHADQVSVSRQH